MENEDALKQEYKRATELFEKNLHTSIDVLDLNDEQPDEVAEKADPDGKIDVLQENLITRLDNNLKIQNDTSIDSEGQNLISNMIISPHKDLEEDDSGKQDSPQKLRRQNSRQKSIHEYMHAEHFASMSG